MFEIGQQVRLIKPRVFHGAPCPLVGTVGEVVQGPPPSQWDPPEAVNWIWVRFTKRVRHGIPTITETPFGFRDMRNSVWLLNECDWDDEDRAFMKVAFDADQLADASEPNPFEGHEDALVEAWIAELDRANKEYRETADSLHAQAMVCIKAQEWDRCEELDNQKDALRKDGTNGLVNWDNCLRAAGLL